MDDQLSMKNLEYEAFKALLLDEETDSGFMSYDNSLDDEYEEEDDVLTQWVEDSMELIPNIFTVFFAESKDRSVHDNIDTVVSVYAEISDEVLSDFRYVLLSAFIHACADADKANNGVISKRAKTVSFIKTLINSIEELTEFVRSIDRKREKSVYEVCK